MLTHNTMAKVLRYVAVNPNYMVMALAKEIKMLTVPLARIQASTMLATLLQEFFSVTLKIKMLPLLLRKHSGRPLLCLSVGFCFKIQM